MSYALSVDDYLLPPPTIDLVAALGSASATFAGQREALAAQRARLDDLYRLAVAESTPDQLHAIAAHLHEYEQKLAAILVPVIRSAETTISKPLRKGAGPAERSFYKLSEEAADIAATWLDLYQNVQIRLHLLASEKMQAEGAPGSPVFSNADEALSYLREGAGES